MAWIKWGILQQSFSLVVVHSSFGSSVAQLLAMHLEQRQRTVSSDETPIHLTERNLLTKPVEFTH